MAATYNPSLASDKDWVRFFIGDRGVDDVESTFVLSDEEINAVLGEEKNKYLAAARCGDVILSQGRGVVSKSVGNLSLSYGDSPESAYRGHLKTLREKGCELLLKTSGSHVFRMM